MTSFKFKPIIPLGETILITGVNGYIASAVANQALAAGYKVRGTVRHLDKAKKLQGIFDSKYGPGKFEPVKVVDIQAEGVLDDVIKGCSGLIHISTDTALGGEPEPYISNTIKQTQSALQSAAKEPTLKRVVLTSSSMAAVPWKSNDDFEWGTESWNEEYIKKAYEPPHGPEKAFFIYAAAKTRGEQEAWKWVKENNPGFVFNTVLPSANFGRSVTGDWQSTGGWAKLVFDGDWSFAQLVPPQKFIDIDDDAILHLGALIHPDVNGERIFGNAEDYNWNLCLAIFRKMYPSRKFVDDLPGLGRDISRCTARPRAEWLLKQMGKDAFTSLEHSLEGAFQGL